MLLKYHGLKYLIMSIIYSVILRMLFENSMNYLIFMLAIWPFYIIAEYFSHWLLHTDLLKNSTLGNILYKIHDEHHTDDNIRKWSIENDREALAAGLSFIIVSSPCLLLCSFISYILVVQILLSFFALGTFSGWLHVNYHLTSEHSYQIEDNLYMRSIKKIMEFKFFKSRRTIHMSHHFPNGGKNTSYSVGLPMPLIAFYYLKRLEQFLSSKSLENDSA
jgi:hypothetical protein